MLGGFGSGSVPLTNRSGSERPKNKKIRLRIRDTACYLTQLKHKLSEEKESFGEIHSGKKGKSVFLTNL
jgi:hypothetical protein